MKAQIAHVYCWRRAAQLRWVQELAVADALQRMGQSVAQGRDNQPPPQVCAAAGVERADVVYVEAHGTGTVVGDAQELAAIDRMYGAGAGRAAEAPLLIGSVKSNMGHCEGCSGLAGMPPCTCSSFCWLFADIRKIVMGLNALSPVSVRRFVSARGLGARAMHPTWLQCSAGCEYEVVMCVQR